MSDKPCTCHPDDNPPVPCPQKFALSECRAAAREVERERCAKIVEQYSVEIDGIAGTSRSLKPLADIIRSGQ